MARTKQQQLDDLDTLIKSIESQEITGYSSTGVSVQLPDLNTLYQRREILEKQAAKEKRSGKIPVKRAVPRY